VIWTEQNEKQLATWWQVEGLSASQIAKRLPGTTRNAVISKVHRLGLSKSGRHAAPAPAKRASGLIGAAIVKTKVARERALSEQPPAPPIEPPGVVWSSPEPLRLVQLQGRHCRWPVGLATGADQLFCAESRDGDGPYCAQHTAIGGAGMSAADWDRRNAKAVQRAMAS